MKETLVLNADYRPLSRFPLQKIGWQEAVKLVYEGVYTVVEEYDEEVHSPSITMKIPAVVALKKYHKIPDTHIPKTRYNFYLRDKFTCQYCGDHFPVSELTLDHVFPKSLGGSNDWDNLTTCCVSCNTEKADSASGWVPLNEPEKPSMWQLAKNHGQVSNEKLPEQWRKWI